MHGHPRVSPYTHDRGWPREACTAPHRLLPMRTFINIIDQVDHEFRDRDARFERG